MDYDKIKVLDDRLRELLAREYERETGHKDAEFIRLTKYRGVVSVDLAIAAMHRAYDAALTEASQKVQADCPACSGTGHADDSTEANPVQCMYCGIPMSALSALAN